MTLASKTKTTMYFDENNEELDFVSDCQNAGESNIQHLQI